MKREFATTYPGGGPRVTVEATLKQPQLISRALTDLARKRFVADRIFNRATAEQIAGGAVVFQRSESLYTSRDPEEVGVRSRYPRTAWTEDIFAAFVKKYGLEFPVSDENKRRNAMDVITRGQRKIANSMVKFIDGLAMTLITTDPAVQTMAASGDWTTSATDIISDIATARGLINNIDEGYNANTLIVNVAQELDLLIDKDIRDALPREGGTVRSAVITGMAAPILGLENIIATNQLQAGKVILTDAGVVGSIGDEQPLPDEGYNTYAPGAQQANIYVKTYREEGTDETIVRGARFPVMWLSEPQAAVVITGA